MTAKTLMVQGTGSSVGKSVLVTALCRILWQDGFRVAPFKAQNMALNSYVTRDGGEMGRSQVEQAYACGLEPVVDMNPILLKPEVDSRSQVVVLGKPAMTTPAKDYYSHREKLFQVVKESLARLRTQFEVVVIEGAGSPAEINLKHQEIVNMRVAKLARSPVLLVGDIDKGGVFASLIGTLTLLDDEERALVKGFIINKFRGDVSLLQPGLEELKQRTGIPTLGVVPYFHDIVIAQEDSLHQLPGEQANTDTVEIAVIYLPRISNATDFEPLQHEPGVRLRYVRLHQPLGHPDLIILPGTKSTIADLEALRSYGLDKEIVSQAHQGTPILGICGGYQMLGRTILDPMQVESTHDQVAGLGLLNVTTSFASEKTTYQAKAVVLGQTGFLSYVHGQTIEGYEIHMGQTEGPDRRALFAVERIGGDGQTLVDGAADAQDNVLGTYLHGLFHNDALRQGLVHWLRQRKNLPGVIAGPNLSREEHFDRLAQWVRGSLNMNLLYSICGLKRKL